MGKTLGERVRKLRLAHSYSQRELAKLVGISAGLISFIERDRNKPNYEIVRRLAIVLETTTDYLINGTPPSHKAPEDELIERLRSEAKYKLAYHNHINLPEDISEKIARLSPYDRYVLLKLIDKLAPDEEEKTDNSKE